MSTPVIAAAVVTHDGARWIREVLTSILEQSHGVDEIVVVDDHSRDGTCEIIADEFAGRVRVVPSDAPPPGASRIGTYTRIASNFAQAVRECQGADLVALADQDDRWHADRIARQVAAIGSAVMLASDGRLVDDDGEVIGGTLRSAFPVPAGFEAGTGQQRMRGALGHSIATGSASMLRPRRLIERDALDVPPGWLHDRWWSLVACAMDAMTIDESVVIDYRVRADQVVGLQLGLQQEGRRARLIGHGRRLGPSVAKLRDVHRLLVPLAADAGIRGELSWSRLLRTLLDG